MGYKRARLYKLVFADPEFEGLEIRVKPSSIHTMLEAFRYQTLRSMSPQQAIEQLPQLCDLMASRIVDWNLEHPDSDEVMPVSGASLMEQDLAFVRAVLDAWLETVVQVPAPLDRRSSDGEPSLEQSIPMEPLSASPST